MENKQIMFSVSVMITSLEYNKEISYQTEAALENLCSLPVPLMLLERNALLHGA